MTFSPSPQVLSSLNTDVEQLLEQLLTLNNGDLIYQVLVTLTEMTGEEIERLDWKILRSTLKDLRKGFQIFSPYRHIRKISIFGSSRLAADSPAYQMAVEFAHCVATRGFMVMTGAGGGIMEAANKGAGAEQSFGLNIQLPFEQGCNPFIDGDPKLIDFKYFFTRKLFFVRETDAIALFPGGFGTQDEAFECLTLTQTGKSLPIPLVLVDRPGGSYWQDWDAYISKHLIANHLISPEDNRLYTITDNVEVACEAISGFYRVYHSSRYQGDLLLMYLNQELSEPDLERLNQDFSDIVRSGKIEKIRLPVPESASDRTPSDTTKTSSLPPYHLRFHFNQRDYGRLYQMIAQINQMGIPSPATQHPELK